MISSPLVTTAVALTRKWHDGSVREIDAAVTAIVDALTADGWLRTEDEVAQRRKDEDDKRRAHDAENRSGTW